MAMKFTFKRDQNPHLAKKLTIATTAVISLCAAITLYGAFYGAFEFDNPMSGNFFSYGGILWIILAPFALLGGWFGLKGSARELFETEDVKKVTTSTNSKKGDLNTASGFTYILINVFVIPILCGYLSSGVIYYAIYLLMSLFATTFAFLVAGLMIVATVIICRKLLLMGKNYSIYLMVTLYLLAIFTFGAIALTSHYTSNNNRSNIELLSSKL